jgi:hypothetical protein
VRGIAEHDTGFAIWEEGAVGWGVLPPCFVPSPQHGLQDATLD